MERKSRWSDSGNRDIYGSACKLCQQKDNCDARHIKVFLHGYDGGVVVLNKILGDLIFEPAGLAFSVTIPLAAVVHYLRIKLLSGGKPAIQNQRKVL